MDDIELLMDGKHWRVTGARDLAAFFRALPELLPAGSAVIVANEAWPSDFERFLEGLAIKPDAARIPASARTVSASFHVPVNKETMAELGQRANRHAEPEVATHLIGYRGDRSLLEWYDLPVDPLSIAASLDPAAVRSFASEVGGACEFIDPERSMQLLAVATLELIRDLNPRLHVRWRSEPKHMVLQVPQADGADFSFIVHVSEDGGPQICAQLSEADPQLAFWYQSFEAPDFDSEEVRAREFHETLRQLLTSECRIVQVRGLLFHRFTCEVRVEAEWRCVSTNAYFRLAFAAPSITGKRAEHYSPAVIAS